MFDIIPLLMVGGFAVYDGNWIALTLCIVLLGNCSRIADIEKRSQEKGTYGRGKSTY